MARRYLSIFAKDPASRVVGGDNVDVRFYEGRSDTLATAFLTTDEADPTTLTLPLRAYPRLPTRHVTTQPLTTDTDIEVDSTEGWAQGDVIRFNGGGQQVERAIKTVTDATHIVLDAQIGVAFPVGTAIRGQVGHARIAVDIDQDYSADVANVGEGWKSMRIDFAVQATGAPTDADYVVGTAHGSLSAELVLGSAVIMRGTLAARPAASLAGRLYFATDQDVFYRDNGAAWDEVGAEATHAIRHEPGGADAMAVDAAAATGSLRTLGLGAAQAAQGSVFAAHATRHQPGGADAMAIDAAQGSGSLRTLGGTPTPLVYGGAAQVGTGVVGSPTDHRHALGHDAHADLSGVTADQHHRRTEAKVSGTGTSASVSWTTAFGGTPVVTATVTGSIDNTAGNRITARSTTGATCHSQVSLADGDAAAAKCFIAQEAT